MKKPKPTLLDCREEEGLRRRTHIRKMLGLMAIAIGVLAIVVFIPLWVWYITLAILMGALIYTLYCLYLC